MNPRLQDEYALTYTYFVVVFAIIMSFALYSHFSYALLRSGSRLHVLDCQLIGAGDFKK